MSKLYEPAFADPHGALIRLPAAGATSTTGGVVLAQGTDTPTNLALPAAGYAKGCLFINRGGSIGSFIYANTGDLTTAVWTNIL